MNGIRIEPNTRGDGGDWGGYVLPPDGVKWIGGRGWILEREISTEGTGDKGSRSQWIEGDWTRARQWREKPRVVEEGEAKKT